MLLEELWDTGLGHSLLVVLAVAGRVDQAELVEDIVGLLLPVEGRVEAVLPVGDIVVIPLLVGDIVGILLLVEDNPAGGRDTAGGLIPAGGIV